MRRILSACLAALALAAPAAAQDAGRTSEPKPGDKTVTISGCVTGGPSSYTLATLPAGRGVHGNADEPVGTSGASMSYTLTPRDGVSLAEFVGKRVEVRGALLPAAPATTILPSGDGSRPKKDDSPEAGQAPDDAKVAAVVHPKVAVTSVKLLSATCL